MRRDGKRDMIRTLQSLSAIGLAATALFASGAPANAREPLVIQELGSGPNVYRVEIRNLNRFEVLEAGDSDGVGELHELIVQLASFNPNFETQYDGEKFTGTQLYAINKGGIVGGRRNFSIRAGQHLFTQTNRAPSDETQMWVHVYSNPADTAYNERFGRGRVRLSISARELDCAGQRVCRRHSDGRVSINFQIPEFSTPPSNRCGPDNTFRLEPLDGELQVSGLSETSVFSSTSSSSWYLGTDHKKGGPRLRPFNADICIASTVKPSSIRPVPDNADELIGDRRRFLTD